MKTVITRRNLIKFVCLTHAEDVRVRFALIYRRIDSASARQRTPYSDRIKSIVFIAQPNVKWDLLILDFLCLLISMTMRRPPERTQ